MTSMKTSFFLYLMPSDRQDTALVTVAGGRGAPTSNLWPCWVMYLQKEERWCDTAQAVSKVKSVIVLSEASERYKYTELNIKTQKETCQVPLQTERNLTTD